jgi:hypothetical protein
MAMNHHCVAALANIAAAQARIEGMKSANLLRDQLGESPAYGEDAFNVEAQWLENIARDVLENGWQP